MSKHLSDDPIRFRSVLRSSKGNITRAASVLGITKPYAMNLIKKLKLNEWARNLRQKFGQPATGRPLNKK